MSGPHPAIVRFYVDQDLLGLAKILTQLRYDLTYPGDPGGTLHARTRSASPIQVDTLDEDWLPVAGANGWLVISRDRQIQESLSELSAVREHGVKMVCLTGESCKNKWNQLEAVMTYWPKLEWLSDQDGPLV